MADSVDILNAAKVKVATTWLDGCSGCHMSFLDIDQRLLELAGRIELVYSPLVDAKQYPPYVDVALIEGAVATDEDVQKIKHIRRHTRLLVSLGDCATIGNVPAMRNPFGVGPVMDRAYVENAATGQRHPGTALPVLLERVRPLHEVVKVDLFVPGCPPPADAIFFVICELLEGRIPDTSKVTRFGK